MTARGLVLVAAFVGCGCGASSVAPGDGRAGGTSHENANGGAEAPARSCRRIGIMGGAGALPSSTFHAWLETQGASVTHFHATGSEPPLQRNDLKNFDLVVVDWLERSYGADEAQTLADWVAEGGGLFVMAGHDSGASADRHVSLLSALGPGLDVAAGPIDGPASFLSHPTTADERGAVLGPISFFGGLRVVIPSTTPDLVPIAVVGSDVVAAAGPFGDGFVLVFGDEWITFDSEWSSVPSVPRFWENAVRWLSSGVSCD